MDRVRGPDELSPFGERLLDLLLLPRCLPVGGQQAGDAEVENLGMAVLRHPDVGGGQVAVDEPLAVRLGEPRHRPRPAAEAGTALLAGSVAPDALDGDLTAEALVAGEEDLPHAAPSKGGLDAVRAKTCRPGG